MLCLQEIRTEEDTMLKLKWLTALVLFFLVAQPGFADDPAKIQGIWRLVSFQVEFQASGERQDVRGKNPAGYIMFTPEGRMMVMVTNEGRKPATTDQDRAGLFNSLIAYTGMYRIEGDKWITKVDVASSPERVGTEQPRFFKIDGDRLQESTPYMQWTAQPEKGMARFIITYERAK
jgi:hypothetical protein